MFFLLSDTIKNNCLKQPWTKIQSNMKHSCKADIYHLCLSNVNIIIIIKFILIKALTNNEYHFTLVYYNMLVHKHLPVNC